MPRRRTVLGIDLAGVPTRPTGICVLEGMKATTSLVHTDPEIIGLADTFRPAVITIDAPLSLPPGRSSIDDRNGEHLRPCDRELLRRRIRFFPITLGPMRGLTRRGIYLKETLEGIGHRVFEVYPGGAQDLLGIPRKQKGLDLLQEGHERLGIRGLGEDLSDHELDAVTAAFVGRLFLLGRYEVFGSLEDGAILMPRTPAPARHRRT